MGTFGISLNRSWLCLGSTFLCGMILPLAGCGGPQSSARQETASGDVQCENPVWDFGTIKGSTAEALKHSFRLKNTSQKQVDIKRIVTSCSCAVAEDYSRSIAPGATVEIPVRISVYGPPGPFGKSFEVFLEDASGSSLFLRAHGVIESTSEIYATPLVLDFGELSNSPVERTITLSRYDGTPLRCREFLPRNAAIALVGTIDEDLAKGTATARLSLNPSDLPGGRFLSDVTIATEHQDSPTVRFGTVATICSEPNFLVNSIVIPHLTSDHPVTKGVFLSGPSSTHAASSITYSGDDSIVVDSVASNDVIDSIRISLSTGPTQHRVLAKGKVLVSITGFTKPFEIPIRVLLPRPPIAGTVPANVSPETEPDTLRKTQ